MKKNIFIFCILSILNFSCVEKTDVTDLEKGISDLENEITGLEGDIEGLKDKISKLESVLSLHAAYGTKKEIVSATVTTVNGIEHWVITFSDNTFINLPKIIVKELTEDEESSEYLIELADNQAFIFNSKEAVYPTDIVILTQSLSYMRGVEVMFEFRVNPSNAIFNYDLSSKGCNISLDRIGNVKTYSSYVNDPKQYSLVKIEPSVDEAGNVKKGQYRGYIRDKANTEGYNDAVALVFTTRNSKGDTINLSSSVMNLERKIFTRLPVVTIRTDNEKEIRDKENWIPGDIKIDGINIFPGYEGKMSIRGRGNSTWEFPKKPYAIKLDSKDSILGMPKHKRWVLLANYRDRTLMRNHVAFEISRRTGLEWTSRGQFVEVMLNDVHLGNYYLCEQIRVDENRVNITEMKARDLDEEAITGGYLLELDTSYDEINKFISEIKKLPVMFKDPDEEVLQPEQFEYMQNYINTVERMLFEDEDYIQTREYTTMIDEDSFIDWWFVMELSGNIESVYPRSSYLNKDRNGLLKAGPVWDFDYSTFRGSTDFFSKESIWYGQLFKDPAFVSKVKERWELLRPRLDEINPIIDELRLSLARSESLNTKMWDIRNTPSVNGDETLSFDDACSLMKSKFSSRLQWLDSQIMNMR